MSRCTAAALLAALCLAGCSSSTSLTRAEARAHVAEVLAATGLEGVEVADEVRDRTFGPDDAPVWRVTAVADGGSVELWVEKTGGRARFLRDVADDGSPLLGDGQVATIEGYETATEQDLMPVAAGVAAALLASVAVALGALRIEQRRLTRP